MIAQENGWEKAKPKKAVVVQKPAVHSYESAVVIYTQELADEVLKKIANKDQKVADLVASTRQKEGHVVLVASTENAQGLKECLQWLKSWGFQAKEYRIRPSPMVSSAIQGMDEQVREAGLCHNFLKGEECPYKGHCKYKCYR